MPIAGGECLTGTYEWRVFVERDCFDIGQPDGAFTGGLGDFLKVAAMLDGRGRGIATHSWGAGGACILEIAPDYAGLHSDVIGDSFQMQDGYAIPPDKPGLGIVLTDEIKNRYPFVPGSGEFNDVPGKILAE